MAIVPDYAGPDDGTGGIPKELQPTHADLLMAAAINATLYQNLNFNFRRDIAPIAGFIRTAYFMEVNPSVPVNTVPVSGADAN